MINGSQFAVHGSQFAVGGEATTVLESLAKQVDGVDLVACFDG